MDVFFPARPGPLPSADPTERVPGDGRTPEQAIPDPVPDALNGVDPAAQGRAGGPDGVPDRVPSSSVKGGRAESATAAETATAVAAAAASQVSVDTRLARIAGVYVDEIPLDAVRPNPRQPREAFDEAELAELADSIRTVGLLQPIVVRPSGPGRYELVMGERRWRAAAVAGLRTISAIVRETADDDMLRDALLENLHRAQLNAIEEAAAYQQLLDDFGCTHDELAMRLRRSRPQISNTLRLLRLPPLVQHRLASGVLTAGHARALLGLDDSVAIERLARRIVEEGLSVRTVERLVALGGVAPVPARRTVDDLPPRVADAAAHLSQRLEARVHVDLGRRKGRVTIEFTGLDDLERIMASLAPATHTGDNGAGGAGGQGGAGGADRRTSGGTGADDLPHWLASTATETEAAAAAS